MKKTVLIIFLIFVGIMVLFSYRFYDNGSTSKSVVEAIEKQRGNNFVNYIIHQQPVPEGVVVFFLRRINDNQIVVSTEYVKKTSRGWKWVYGGGHSGSNIRLDTTDQEAQKETFSKSYIPSTEGTVFGKSPFPMIYGVVLNSDIARIVVKDCVSGLERQSTVVEVNNHFKLYYVFLDDLQGKKFDIIAYNRNGLEIKREFINEELQSQSSKGASVNN